MLPRLGHRRIFGVCRDLVAANVALPRWGAKERSPNLFAGLEGALSLTLSDACNECSTCCQSAMRPY